MTLKVGIIGAGIGGLSAAIALRRAGAQVEIFERSNFKDEIGAAITITPNGMRVLEHFGFDPKTARGVHNKQVRMVDPCTFEDLVVENFSGVEDDYGAPFMFFHRVDLHTALKEMALSADERYPGSPVVIHNGVSVINLNCENGTIVLDNWETFEGDLIVVADGVRTKLIDKITQKDVPLEDLGSSFYRCLIPFSEVNKNPDLAAIFKDQDPGFWVPFDLSTGTFVVTYPCRNGEMLNVAFRHQTKAENEHAVDWNNDTNVQDIISMVGRFNPLVAKLFGLSTSVSVHKLFRREPLETYTRGRAVIIGDAAHPIQPTHAQGAVLAIEEAAALEVLFKDVQNPKRIPERLELYNGILKRRTHVTQLLSDAQPGISSDLRKRADDIWEESIFPPDAMNFTKPIRDFFYSWDIMKEAENALDPAREMISQTYIVAFITAYLVAGSQAGPCKPSSRITESLVTSDVSTTIGSATATSSVETTTVASSSTYLSNEESSVIITESVSSTETSLPSEETSTTALSTTEGTTTEIATTTEAVTATATTTTSEEPSTIPFIGNGGFDDYDSSIEPWRKYGDVDALSIDSDIKHDGRYSARIEILGHSLLQYSIAQPLRGSITAGVTYTMSAWVRPNPYCFAASLQCTYQSDYSEHYESFILSAADEWTYISSTCSYTQEQIDSGGLYLVIGVVFSNGLGVVNIDTVDFSA
ncbi:unnamed protein product [Fusarium graminearum]|nr:unnamed protein product [Fusarium graminearum]